MAVDMNGNGRRKLFEPVISFGSGLVLVALLAGGMTAFFNVKSDFGRMDERAAAFQEELGRVVKAVDGINELIQLRAPQRYTKDDASRDFSRIDHRLDQIDDRVRALEGRGFAIQPR